MNKRASIITISISMGLAIVALVTALIIFITTTNVYATQLENVYMRSFYELSGNINDLEVDLSKLIATTSKNAQKELLTNLYNTSNVANTNISNLPVNNKSISDINTYVNKLGGFSFSLIEKINNDSDWSEGDIKSVSDLHSHAVSLKYELNNYISSIKFDYKILSQIDYNNEESSGLNGVFTNIQGTNSKVPTLIYDGPFADSVVNPKALGLSGEEITQEQAEQVINNKLTAYNIKTVSFAEMTQGIFTTYNFNVETESLDLFVQVTKVGGHILDITSYGKGGDQNLGKTAAENVARDFARELGYENLFPVWSMVNGNVVYVNLAPIVNGTIYYPDLIKVKVDRKLGVVAGWEAQNYYFNNRERSLPTATVSMAQAQSALSPLLTVVEKNKALIPLPYSSEVLTHEFVCTWKDYVYYIYVDVTTGQEVNILRIIHTNAGDLIL